MGSALNQVCVGGVVYGEGAGGGEEECGGEGVESEILSFVIYTRWFLLGQV